MVTGTGLTGNYFLRSSILYRLSLFFLGVVLLAAFAGNYLYRQVQAEQLTRAESDVDRILRKLRQSILQPYAERRELFESSGYRIIDDGEEMTEWIDTIPISGPEKFEAPLVEAVKDGRLIIGVSAIGAYVYIPQANPPFMVLGPSRSDALNVFLGIGVFFMVALLLLYLSIVHNLWPLKRLAREIQRFGETGTAFVNPIKGNDEIAYVSHAFEEAIRKNRALTEARHLFLRNVMHELKTPITSGKLALAMQPEGRERDILERSFRRLEHLIAEMARVEQVTSQLLHPELQYENLSEMITSVQEDLLLTSEQVVCKSLDDLKIRCDRGMMITIIKNLIDNAMKYALDTKVDIVKNKAALEFRSQGKPWPPERSFETMLEPFVHASGAQQKRSFGLGLYIIHAMAKAQGMGFSHRYDNHMHIFSIEGLSFFKGE